MARTFIVLTSGTTWVAPLDCTSISVECLSGGGGLVIGNIIPVEASYSRSNNIPVTPFQKFYYQVGAASGSSWFNTINAMPVVGTQNSANSCMAYTYPGITQATQLSGGIGDIKFYGGISDYVKICGGACPNSDYVRTGGGAAGPNGNGGDAGNLYTSLNSIYGGGADGGTSASLTDNGKGPLGNTDGTNGAPVTVTATPITISTSQYIVWTDSVKNKYGIGGGFSNQGYLYCPSFNLVGYGVVYNPGLIVISYVPAGTPGNSYTEVYQGNLLSNTLIDWRVPVGVTSIKVEALGSGSGPTTSNFNTYSGAGGAYSSATISVLPGQIFSGNIGGSNYGAGANTTFSNLSTVLVNAGGAGIGGNTAVGGIVYVGTGYSGGNGALNSGTTLANFRTAGAGGAGGPNGPGGDGGPPYQPGGGTSGAGGGGGGAGLVGSPVTLSPTSLAANGTLFFSTPKTLIPGTSIIVSGAFGSGGLTGYTDPTTYYIRSTNGTSSANLCLTYVGTTIAATATSNFGTAVFTISNRGGVGGLGGAAGVSTQGGAGGAGAFRDSGGLGGSTTANATSGINGSGGGGGGLLATYRTGAPSSNVTIYSSAQSNTAIGFFIGGGGGGSAGSATIRGAAGKAYYGGGTAAGADNNYVQPGVGLLAITYTIAANTNASESSMMSMF